MCAVDFTAWHFLRPLGCRLKQEGFDVVIACGSGYYVEKLRQEGFSVLENPIARSMNPVLHVAEIWRTYRLLRRERFDVVHVHTPIAALVGRVAAWLARVPIRIYTAHGFYFHEGMPPAKQRFHILLERFGARFGDFIMTVSGEDEETALKERIAKPGRVETIYNGVDVRLFDPAMFPSSSQNDVRTKLGIPHNARVVGFVGRLVREKGILELVQAIAQLTQEFPDIRLLVVGDVLKSDYDAGKDEFMSEARRLNVHENIVFAGMVDDTRPYLAAMDIFCLPSYREGMPVSLLEAMAMARPCVATNIRGCREEIVNGACGLLVPPRNARALADAIAALLRNPDRMQAIATAARERVVTHFNLQKVLDHQVALYHRLLKEKLPDCWESLERHKLQEKG
jgi:glycosyltransferase involved in cell wall biosynthesis